MGISLEIYLILTRPYNYLIKSVYVKRCPAKVENNKIVEYRAVVKIAFLKEREKRIN